MKVSADDIATGLYEVFRERAFLRTTELLKASDPVLEPHAAAILLAAAEHGRWNEFEASPMPVRQMACALLMDFLAKLMGPLAHREWDVQDGLSDSQCALAAVAAEIRKSHPRLATKH